MKRLIFVFLALALVSCTTATPTAFPTRTPTDIPPTLTSTTEPTSAPTRTPRPTNTKRPTATSPSKPHSCIPNKEPVEARVVRIVDGDTIEVSVVGRIEKVRLIGIDTPERGEPGFSEASNYISTLVSGKNVLLWQDVSDRDRYSRLLAYVTVGNRFVNYLLVKNGYARSYRYPPDTSCSSLFDSVEVVPTLPPPPAIIVPPASNCHPSYEGACLKIGAGDYDCAGGSGNGPNYTGKVRVVGWDEFKLDRDGDGWGCE
jgi:micrococcal nuclease